MNSFLLSYCKIWWLGTESNRRHKDFQSFALPTELPSLIKFKMAVPTGIEPAISCVTGRHVNRYTTGPLGCGDRIWTCDLRVMSPTSYRTAPPRDDNIWWRMTGSNRRPPACKAGALPAELILHYYVDKNKWWPVRDSNPCYRRERAVS